MAHNPPLHVDVCFLPSELKTKDLDRRAVVVFDVLRATTSMIAALHAGVASIAIYPSTSDVRSTGRASPSALLCGEEDCLPPPGFDLGNSPGAFQPALHNVRNLLMSTTNGTRAILAAHGAAKIFVGALVNASAVASRLSSENLPVTLLCSGTNGAIAMEDILGAGAVMAFLAERTSVRFESDSAHVAQRLFTDCRHDLAATLRLARGGLNLIRAGLPEDIDFAARLNAFDIVGEVSAGEPPVVTARETPKATPR